MQIGLSGSPPLVGGGGHAISRSTVTDDKEGNPLKEVTQPLAAPAAMIGNVETMSDGRTGVVIAATVVGRAPPSGLMIQVQLKPTDGKGPDNADDIAERVKRGMAPSDAPGLTPSVRQADELAPEERDTVKEMQARDASVRREEQAHAAAAGAMAGPIRYEFATGPDGRRYAVNGKVSIDAKATSGDPREMERMGRRLSAAAMSAQAPSSADYAAAAKGYRAAGEARDLAASEARDQAGDREDHQAGMSVLA